MHASRQVVLKAAVCILGFILYSVAESVAVATADPQRPVDPVVSRGLKHTRLDRSTTDNATILANRLLATAGYRLDASWKHTVAGAANITAIPLFSVATKRAAPSTPAAVPKDCLCIFVDPKALRAWLKVHSRGPGRLKVDQVNALVFMLLHEVGHIVQKTSGVAYEHGAISQLNIAPSIAKINEEDADDFAATLIRNVSSQVPISDASIAATQVAGELLNLAWNLQAYRLLDKFGSTVTNDPDVFFDGSYSHPNLEWRILRGNHIVQQSEISKQLLDAFEDARAHSQNRQPIYKAN